MHCIIKSCYLMYWEKYKSHIKTTHKKHQLHHGMTNLNYLVDYVLYVTLKIVSSISTKTMKHETITDNRPIQTNINKIKNRITYKIKTYPLKF